MTGNLTAAYNPAVDIFTIGHSNHRWDDFSPLLKQHGVQVLVDVRSNPVSRHAPFANKNTLPSLLEGEGIRYAYLGDALGGKPTDASCYDTKGKPAYEKMRSSASFQQGIGELLKLAESSRAVLMCAEEDPAKCHRRLLIGPALVQRGGNLQDIRGDGSVHGSHRVASKKAYQRQLQRALPFQGCTGRECTP